MTNRPVHSTNLIGNEFRREKSDLSTLVTPNDFYMNASELWSKCTAHEWHLIGRIGAELNYLCALWHCDPKIKNNSSNLKAIKSLISKGIIFKTETTDIYLVNPNYIRRGDVATVLYTTAATLQDVKKVQPNHIKTYKAIDSYKPIVSAEDLKDLN